MSRKTNSKVEMSQALLEQVASRFKTLSDPSRLRILQFLMAGPQPVNELVAQMQCSQPNVSKHLQVLYQSGIVRRVKKGNQSYYEIADASIFELCKIMCDAVQERASKQKKSMQ